MGFKNKVKLCVFIFLNIMVVISCTACAGFTMQEMKNQGEQLLNDGSKMNDELISDAQKVNNSIINSNGTIGDGWISELNNIAVNVSKYRIQLASQNDLLNKTTIDDIQDFMEKLELDRWEVVDEFPEKIGYDNVLFFQEEISEKNKYKNIANVHLLEGKNIVLVTVAKGLVDLSDEFVPQDDSFTSIYRVPESVAQYLESLSNEK